MKSNGAIVHVGALSALLVACLSGGTSPALAAERPVEIPLRNWTPPAVNTDAAGAAVFVPMVPCRVVDTRNAAGAFGGPIIPGTGAARTFPILTSQACPGLPAAVTAWSMNVTVIGSSGTSYSGAYLTVWNAGAAWPGVSTVNFGSGQVVANAAIVPGGAGGSVDVAANRDAHVILDLNGYYTQQPNSTRNLLVMLDAPNAPAIFGQNSSATLGTGVMGQAMGAGTVRGVWGQLGASTLAGSAGVAGLSASTTAGTFGVLGSISTFGGGGAGVKGHVDGASYPSLTLQDVGVRGDAFGNVGVQGNSKSIGVQGWLANGAGTSVLAWGALGYLTVGAGNFGVFASGNMHATGNLTAGTKSFVQPHPTDPTREIHYVSLEGPASEIYFRGSAQAAKGTTVIPVPEHFRLAARPGSYSAIVSAVGRPTPVSVVDEGPDGIVVEALRETKVNFVVYAEREAFPGHDPLPANTHFVPEDEKGFVGMPAGYTRLLVENGTLNPDGSTNLSTAERAGWKRAWDERRERRAAEAAAAAAAIRGKAD